MGNLFSDLQKARDEQKAAIESAVSLLGPLEGRKPENQKTSFLESQKARKPENKILSPEPRPLRVVKKAAFELDEQTIEAIEGLKFSLRKPKGPGVTKNELVEIAIEFLARDYRENQKTSFLENKLSRKQGTQEARKPAF